MNSVRYYLHVAYFRPPGPGQGQYQRPMGPGVGPGYGGPPGPPRGPQPGATSQV